MLPLECQIQPRPTTFKVSVYHQASLQEPVQITLDKEAKRLCPLTCVPGGDKKSPTACGTSAIDSSLEPEKPILLLHTVADIACAHFVC